MLYAGCSANNTISLLLSRNIQKFQEKTTFIHFYTFMHYPKN